MDTACPRSNSSASACTAVTNPSSRSTHGSRAKHSSRSERITPRWRSRAVSSTPSAGSFSPAATSSKAASSIMPTPESVCSGPSCRYSESLRRSSCSAVTTRRDSSARSVSRIRVWASSASTRSNSIAFSAAWAAKSANTAARARSSGPNVWPGSRRASTSTACSSPITTSGAARTQAGRRWCTIGSAASAAGWPAAAVRLRAASAISEPCVSSFRASPAIGPSATPRAAAGRMAWPSASGTSTHRGINGQQPLGLVGGALQHATRIQASGDGAQALHQAVQEAGLRHQLAAQAPVPVLGGAQPVRVAAHRPHRQAAHGRGHDQPDGDRGRPFGQQQVGDQESDRRQHNGRCAGDNRTRYAALCVSR